MDIIVSKMAEGAKFSKALKLVYDKRNVCVPCNEELFDVSIDVLNLSTRTSNALMRARLYTVKDVINFIIAEGIKRVRNLGVNSGSELFESILDYSWEHMTNDERTAFLVDAVERNSMNIRAEIA
jgi:DNA-directed RNA polymerase alpha subunit